MMSAFSTRFKTVMQVGALGSVGFGSYYIYTRYYCNIDSNTNSNISTSNSNMNNSTISSKENKYCVLSCSRIAQGYPTHYQDVGDLYIDFFCNKYNYPGTDNKNDENITAVNNSQLWSKYRCFDNEIPSLEELTQYKGIVITGGASDAHDFSKEWINRLRDLVVQIHDHNKNINDTSKRLKMLGICFGAQLIANALNGGTGTGRIGNGDWEIGIKTILFNENFEKAIFKNNKKTFDKYNKFKVNNTNGAKVAESHRDCIKTIPENGVLLASSEKTRVEMFSCDDDILCVQGHPEFENDYMRYIVEARMAKGKIARHMGVPAVSTYHNQTADTKFWKQILQDWLSGNL